MNRIFGSSFASSSKPEPSLQDAISATDTRVETINVKIRKLDAELTRYRDQMKRLRDGPGKQAVQKRALGVLKQKKMYEQQLDSIQAQVFNMENAALTTDNLRNTMATVDAMKQANKEMKKTYGKLDIDKIESIHYDMEDLIEQSNEIQESLGRTYGVPDEIDEADLEAELEALGDDFGLEGEAEGGIPSYLQETRTLPDFVDEAPVADAKESAGPVKAV